MYQAVNTFISAVETVVVVFLACCVCDFRYIRSQPQVDARDTADFSTSISFLEAAASPAFKLASVRYDVKNCV